MKRILSILLTAGLTAAFFSFTAPSAQELEIITLEESAESNVAGDVTGDGTLNRQDLLRLAKHFAGWDVEIHEKNSDVTGDGTINRQDLLRLAKHFAGWDVTLDRYPEPEPEPDPEPEPEPDPEPEP